MDEPTDLPIRRLLDVGRMLVSDLDASAILDRVLAAAREVTGARYAALGVLNGERTGLSEFLTVGIDEHSRRSIGSLPAGRGVLGVLIDRPEPLRLRDVGLHPQSYGFPAAHPPMHTFLGVPIVIRGEAWGNLYLTEKQDGEEFTEADEEAAVILAGWAAAAIDNARQYEASERRRAELERAVRALEATRDIAVAISAATDLDRVFELIVKRGRALIDARAVLIMLRDGADLVVTATAGYASDALGQRIPVAGSTSGQVLERGVPERIADAASRMLVSPAELGVDDAHTALLVPMVHRGTGIGVLAAFDRGATGEPFTETEEQLLRTFAATAVNGIAIARSVEADRLRSSIAAAEAERRRWARELHDETLQQFAALKVMLSGALRGGGTDGREQAIREAVDQIQEGIDGLRAIIADLRPAALDEIGLGPALEGLLERNRDGGLALTAQIELPDPAGGAGALPPELETTVYRLVQEALTNIAKHARASTAHVAVIASGDGIDVEVRDDGSGFDPDAGTSGFGLAGMRERVHLAGGTLTLESGESGTTVRARLRRTMTPAPQAWLPRLARRDSGDRRAAV